MPKITDISKENIKRDKNVLGKKWNLTYNSYFSDEDNLDIFINKSFKYIKKLNKNNLNILYVGSANGLLGERLVSFLSKNNIKSSLTLLDISKKHLDLNKNKKTKKILGDMLTFKLNQKFDLIIMRSCLDYLPSEKLQVKALKNIRLHLCKKGLFINCVAAMPTNKLRDLANNIYSSNTKIGKRHFQSREDVFKLYFLSKFNDLNLIASSKILVVT